MSQPSALPRQPLAVVFDFDGTLVDSEALVREGYFAASHAFRMPFRQEDFLDLVGKHRDANESSLRALWGEDFPLESFYAAVSAHIGDQTAPLKPGALRLMDLLDERCTPFALATSSGPDWVRRSFDAHALHGRFRAVVTRDDVENRKPHPEPYLKAVAELGFAPGDVLAIEDSPTGLESAHAAGLMTVMAPDLLSPTDLCRRRADCIVRSLHDVVVLLQS
jgi:HAD superfamily hydrolase (TIGR01509 family)